MSHRPKRHRHAVAVATLTLGITLVGVPASSSANDPSRAPQAVPSAAAPGDIIQATPGRFTLDPILKLPFPGVRTTKILYRSQDSLGDPIDVSGTVIVPRLPWLGGGKRPIVTYAVGTRGLGDACAPSATLANGTDYEGFFIAGLLLRGWAVVVTDYEGLGTPGQHTYVVGQSEGRAVLDAARAAQRLPGSGLDASHPVGVMGYSQGGGAAAWAAELAATYAPELQVKGTAAGGVPADLIEVGEFLDGSPAVALALLAAVGYDAEYAELDLEDYLNARGSELLDRAQDFCLLSLDGIVTLIETAFTHISDYTTTNPLETAPWQARLNQNRLGSTSPSAPVYQYHGQIDEIVAFPQAATLRQEWCAHGANVTWSVQPLSEHVLGAVLGYPAAANFLDQRFKNVPTSGNC